MKLFFRWTEKTKIALSTTWSKGNTALGYHQPKDAVELLKTTERQLWLQTLWKYSSLPKELHQQYYLQPLERCVTLMQKFPATEKGHHSYLGGMIDHMLATVAYSVRLSKGYLLPIGAPPEDQASQGAAWEAVIVYAALFYSLEGVCHLEVELKSGKRWMPVKNAPNKPYRFRFASEPSLFEIQNYSAMLAYQILPYQAIEWLSEWPEVLHTLVTYIAGSRPATGVIHTLVSEAMRISSGQFVGEIDTLPPEQQQPKNIGISTEESDSLTDGIGEHFWQWLVDGCHLGSLAINMPESRIHFIAGFVFLQSPGIFYQYKSENPSKTIEKPSLQKAFERLGRHRRDKGTLYCCYLYKERAGEGEFKKMSGYLIAATKLFHHGAIPQDNPRLVIKPHTIK
ncbi:TraI domain-containing protein [Yersinia enterocolitica]|uniref:TraI domain-containing protein n=1 Tax=Yersinia enterocolitica TaxID=630 RepID=UPI0021ADBE64|nr:TraI domain-containing protein [Yersinia enterocolitica]